MKLKLLLLIGFLSIFLISGCSENIEEKPKTLVFIVPQEEVPEFKTYTIEEEYDEAWLHESRERRNKLNEWRDSNQVEDDEEQRILSKKSKRWVRIYDGEMITGYDEETDDLFYKFDKEHLKE